MTLQSFLPFAPWTLPHTRRLPGTQPLAMADWLQVDDAYAGQMALRAALIDRQPEAVIGQIRSAAAAVEELYHFTLAHLPAGFVRQGDRVIRPDGQTVDLTPAQPLHCLGRLVQEDLCLMQDDGQEEHRLTAAVLCFPAGWTLAEKLGHPMGRIHQPVAKYTPDVAQRVQRLMSLVRVGAPLWRANAHFSRAELFNPLSETAPKDLTDQSRMPYVRSERQCLIRLPETRAVVFSIHTYRVAVESLSDLQRAALEAHPIHRAE